MKKLRMIAMLGVSSLYSTNSFCMDEKPILLTPGTIHSTSVFSVLEAIDTTKMPQPPLYAHEMPPFIHGITPLQVLSMKGINKYLDWVYWDVCLNEFDAKCSYK